MPFAHHENPVPSCQPLNATCATRQRMERYRYGVPNEMNTLGRASHDMEEVRGHALHLRHPHHEPLTSLPSHRFLTWGITRHMRKIRTPRPVYSIRCHKFLRLNAEGCRARGSRYPQVEGSVRDETTPANERHRPRSYRPDYLTNKRFLPTRVPSLSSPKHPTVYVARNQLITPNSIQFRHGQGRESSVSATSC